MPPYFLSFRTALAVRACPAFAEALSRVKRKSKGICFCELSTAFRASREVGRIRIRVRLQAYRKDVPYRSRARRSPLGVSTTGDVHPSRDPSLRDVILSADHVLFRKMESREGSTKQPRYGTFGQRA